MADNGDGLNIFEAPTGLGFGGRPAHLDEATVLHYPGSSGLSGDYQGRKSVVELLQRMEYLTNGTIRFGEWETLTAGDQDVVLRGHVAASRGDRTMGSDLVLAMAMRGDKIREIWVFHLDQPHVDEFWTET